jgi:hypothetical protein
MYGTFLLVLWSIKLFIFRRTFDECTVVDEQMFSYTHVASS